MHIHAKEMLAVKLSCTTATQVAHEIGLKGPRSTHAAAVQGLGRHKPLGSCKPCTPHSVVHHDLFGDEEQCNLGDLQGTCAVIRGRVQYVGGHIWKLGFHKGVEEGLEKARVGLSDSVLRVMGAVEVVDRGNQDGTQRSTGCLCWAVM